MTYIQTSLLCFKTCQ